MNTDIITNIPIRNKSKAFAMFESAYNIFIFTVLAIYCISLLLPLFWMIYSSFKNEVDYTLNTFGLPEIWEISNYPEVLRLLKAQVLTPRGIVEYGILSMALHSIIRAGGGSLVGVFVTACVAYIMARYKFRGNGFIYALGIFVMITPIVGNLPSDLLVKKALGIYDNLFLAVITGPSVVFGLHFLLLYGAFKGIPKSYTEAAHIDGAGHYSIMFRIIMPMVVPTCAVLFVLDFLAMWNDYLMPMIWLPSFPDLAYGMYKFQYNATSGSSGATTPQILAGFTVIMIPTVILYLSMQRLIMSRLMIGGLKG